MIWYGLSGSERRERIFPAVGNPDMECQLEEIMRGTHMCSGMLCYRESEVGEGIHAG